MEYLSIFPHLNASLNALSGIFLMIGFVFIRKKRVERHRFCMISACIISLLFLVSYVTHHIIRTSIFGLGPTKFPGEGAARVIYFTVLISHTVLAVLIGPFVVVTLRFALKRKFDKHKRLARWVFPFWLYVSITGVIVYLMLYQLFPAN